jgi:triosephosphate isomerase
MRRALVAGNWKMNGSRETARALAAAIARGASRKSDVAICPPFPYLEQVGKALSGSSVVLAAQDVSANAPGAFTGEVSAQMLHDVGCRMVLVGHSERRHGLGESDALVAAKFLRAMDIGLVPVLCVGEMLAERDAGQTAAVVERQLTEVFRQRAAADLAEYVVAYEPVWAIGTGRTASPQQAQEVHALLRARIASAGGDHAATRILSGGSVKPDNAAELFRMADIDGGLIGGASLDAGGFLAICEAAGG